MSGPTDQLAAWVSDLEWDSVPAEVRDRALLVLFDTIGCIRAGAATTELDAADAAWAASPGKCTLAQGSRVNAESAAWLNGTAAVLLELDAGNRSVGGHPAAHVVAAILALAQAHDVTDGRRLCVAFLAGHEVASRCGRAVRLTPGLHPHGSWGSIGAAAGCARLLGAIAAETAAAMDFAGSLLIAAPFEAALVGATVRDHWVGHANLMGLIGARLARGGALGPAGGMFETSVDVALGTLDPAELTAQLGTRYDISTDYIKRHSACGYVHSPIDALIDAVGSSESPDPHNIERIEVSVTSAATVLAAPRHSSRLASMFSIPHALASYLVTGSTGPELNDEQARNDPVVTDLARRVVVRADADLDAATPHQRGASVAVITRSGDTLHGAVDNAVGDGDGTIIGWGEVRAKVASLIGEAAAAELEGGVRDLPTSTVAHEHIHSLLGGRLCESTR